MSKLLVVLEKRSAMEREIEEVSCTFVTTSSKYSESIANSRVGTSYSGESRGSRRDEAD